MDFETTEAPDLVTHVVFDPGSGRILGTLRHDRDEGADSHETCGCGQDAELLQTFLPVEAQEAPVPALTDLPADAPSRLDLLRVDPRSRALRVLPSLVVDTERSVLEGDGEDTVAIEIRAVDESGAVLTDFSGEVHVRTGRGKLSARGGMVRLEGGRATVKLTSVAETVDAVPLVVHTPDGSAAPARTSLAFE